ncbi:MAG: hypothetical protein PHQ34_08290 [Methanothrix sp.]|nr:hypothetical protein [Methanothrix sp.]
MRTNKSRWALVACLAIALFVIVPATFVGANASGIEAAPGQEVGDHINLEPSASVLSFSVAGDVTGWSINPASSPESNHGSLTINADSAWSVTVTSNNGGHFKQCFSGNNSYGSKILKNPLEISVESASGYTGHTISLDNGGTLVEGSGSYSGTIPFTYEQAVDWTDAPLSYRIELTFETSPT